MQSDVSIVLFGAGGHGKVIADCIEHAGGRILGFLDDTRTGTFFGYPILGTRKDIPPLRDRNILAVVCVGNAAARAEVTALLNAAGIALATVVHPSAQIARGAKIGAGTVVLPGAVVGPDAVLGTGCIINTGATVDHDCILGDYVHIAPGAHLAGTVHVGRMTHVGIDCAVREGILIGERVMVGAGAAVVDDLPDACTAVGVPAKPVQS